MKRFVERALLPRRAARIVALEPRLWVCLVRWLVGRGRPRADELTYHKGSPLGVFLFALAFTTPVELLLGALLIPWAWLRWTLLFATIYALIWVVGFYASLVVLPHRLEAMSLRLHYGALAEVVIPHAEIARVERAHRKAPKERDGLFLVRDQSAAYFAIGGSTEVSLWLRAPVTPQGALGPTAPVTVVHVAVDEPERLVKRLAERVGEGATPVTANADSSPR